MKRKQKVPVSERMTALLKTMTFSEVKALADGGDREVRLAAGIRYETGNGTECAPELAMGYYRLAAEQGDAVACRLLAHHCYRGECVAQSSEAAAHWFRLAAEAGDAEAQFSLGSAYAQFNLAAAYHNGEGVTQSARSEAHWLRRAADHGLPEAMRRLALYYASGSRAKRSAEKAVRYCRQAAGLGDRQAERLLPLLEALARGESVRLPLEPEMGGELP